MADELEDPDNPRSIFEHYGRREEQRKNRRAENDEEEQRKNGDTNKDEPAERGVLGPEEVEIDPSVLEEDEVVAQQARKKSYEKGPRKGRFYDLILDELEDINGFNPDMADVDMQGQIVNGEISEEVVRAEYVLEDNLVDTSGDIAIPGIEFAGDDIFSVAYRKNGMEIGIERGEDGSYRFEAGYQNPEDIEKAAVEVAVTVAEFEDELTKAYRL